MEQVVATIGNVLVLSSMYILVALGFAFLFNMLGILNFSHGAIYMVGSYTGFVLISTFSINPWLALLLAAVIMAGVGVLLEKFCFRPFVGDFNRMVMICVAITVILQTTVNIMAGAQTLALPPFVSGVFRAGPVAISYERIVTFAIGFALLAATVWFVRRTRWGLQMQAIAQNKEGASLQGIDVDRMSALACAIGCGLAAVAGCLMGAYGGIGPFMGDFMLVKVLMLVILAGVGSIGGIFIAGLVLGCLDAVLPVVINGGASQAVAVGLVVVLLLIRPSGFFGHEA